MNPTLVRRWQYSSRGIDMKPCEFDRERSRVANLFSSPLIRISMMMLVVGATLLLAGCGPRRVRIDYSNYENSYAVTSNHEELLNLARLQKHDPTYFFKLGQISSSYRMEASLASTGQASAVTTTPAGALVPNGGGSPGLIYENDPSFTLIPVNDDTNASIMLKPIDSTVFYSLYLQGWRLDQLFRLTVSRIEFTVPTQSGCEVKVIRNLPPPWYDANSNYANDGFTLASYAEFLRVSAVIYALQRHGLLLLRDINSFDPVDQDSFIPNSTGSGKKPDNSDTGALAAVMAQAKAANTPVSVTVTVSQPSGGDAAPKNASAPAAKDLSDAAAKNESWQLQGADSSYNGGKWVLTSNSIQPEFVLTSHEQLNACTQLQACEQVEACDKGQTGLACQLVKACEPDKPGEQDPECEPVKVCRQLLQSSGPGLTGLINNCAQEQTCERADAYEKAKTDKQVDTKEQVQACQQKLADQQGQISQQELAGQLALQQAQSCGQVDKCEKEHAGQPDQTCNPVRACSLKKAEKGTAYASEPSLYGQNVLDAERMLLEDFSNPSNGMTELLGPKDPTTGELQPGPDLTEILEVLYNGFSIQESSADQEAEKDLCSGGSKNNTPTNHLTARLVMRSLIGLMAAAADEQQSFDALEKNDPILPTETHDLVTDFYRSVYQATNPGHNEPIPDQILQRLALFPKPATELRFSDFAPSIEQLPMLKMTARKGDPPLSLRQAVQLSSLGLKVSYRNSDFFIDDPEPDHPSGASNSNQPSASTQPSGDNEASDSNKFPFVPDNQYWNRDMFRLINELSSQVSVDISKFPLPEVLQLRTE